MNSIIAIHPYMTQGIWVFDDAAVGLREEPFISGADTIIERMVEDIPDARGSIQDGRSCGRSTVAMQSFANNRLLPTRTGEAPVLAAQSGRWAKSSERER